MTTPRHRSHKAKPVPIDEPLDEPLESDFYPPPVILTWLLAHPMLLVVGGFLLGLLVGWWGSHARH